MMEEGGTVPLISTYLYNSSNRIIKYSNYQKNKSSGADFDLVLLELDEPLETAAGTVAAFFGGGLEDFNFLVTGNFSCNEDFVLELELDEDEEDDELEELELSELELSVDKLEPFLLFL